MKKMLLLAITASLLTINAFASTKVVYGDDNRVDVFASTNPMFVELSRSTAAMISKYSVSSNGDGTVSISGKSLEARGMCKSERFSSQKVAANCSGFLVGEDLLVTAGHCITGESKCRSYKWVFDYKVSHDEEFDFAVSESNVYGCSEIISRSLDSSTSNDYALIRLDRKVTDRRVLTYRTQGHPQVGDALVVIGHPTGLPTKIADGANVVSLSNSYFSANLDTYGGNSGSAVFNATTGDIEGILVRGATDYVYDSNQGCRVTNVLPNSTSRGEEVTYITNIKELQ